MPTLLENMKPHIAVLSIEERRKLILHMDQQIKEKLSVGPAGDAPDEMRAGMAELDEARAYLVAIVEDEG